MLSLDELWNHSLQVGNLAKQIARSSSTDKASLDEALVAGMMHDIGKLIQLRLAGFYPKLHEKVKAGMSPLQAEYEILGTSHAELGAYLLGIWGLPFSIVQAVAYHHRPSHSGLAGVSTIAYVHGAHGVILSRQQADPGQDMSAFDLDYLEKQGLMEQLPRWFAIYDDMSQVRNK